MIIVIIFYPACEISFLFYLNFIVKHILELDSLITKIFRDSYVFLSLFFSIYFNFDFIINLFLTYYQNIL